MNKENIVKSKQRFNEIIHHKVFFKNNLFVIYIMKKETPKPLFGIAVSKSYGTAVERNKIKRQLRNIITNNKFLFPNNADYIIMVKRTCKSLKYSILETELVNLVKEKVNK